MLFHFPRECWRASALSLSHTTTLAHFPTALHEQSTEHPTTERYDEKTSVTAAQLLTIT